MKSVLLASSVAAALTTTVSAKDQPCDIFLKNGNTPCVAAHSTVRALYGAYNGALYEVKRKSDKTKLDIGVLTQGGWFLLAIFLATSKLSLR